MAITAEMVKQLRDKTGAGMMDCKAALAEAGGDIDKAIEILRKKGMASAAKRAGRATKEGIVGHYIHMGGKVGVLGSIPVLFSDYDIQNPSYGTVKTEDDGLIEFVLVFEPAAATP